MNGDAPKPTFTEADRARARGLLSGLVFHTHESRTAQAMANYRAGKLISLEEFAHRLHTERSN